MRGTQYYLFIGALTVALFYAIAHADRAVVPLDYHWQFLQGDCDHGERPNFDDSKWTTVNVPHDWSIAGPFDSKAPAGGAGAFLPTGIGWYRKILPIPPAASGPCARIQFDGVMANSDVWINGQLLGHRPYGYSSFEYDLTDHLSGGENVIAVRVDNSKQPASRWYAGSGIYRHVRLILTDPVHFEHWGTFITTPQVSADQATAHVENRVVNSSDRRRIIHVVVTLFDPRHAKVGSIESSDQTISPGKTKTFAEDIPIQNPALWDVDHPNLYTAQCEMRERVDTLDTESTSFGIRKIEFKPDTGFWLNNINLKIKGVCLHGDMGALGVAVPLGAWEHRLAALKRIGCNAIRTAHNPPAPEFLDLCDRMGFLVMDEIFDCWTIGKNPYDYSQYFKDWSLIDLHDAVVRDRNHPSIILYSAGNEIRDTRRPNDAKDILSAFLTIFHAADPTRPVTQAILRPNVTHDYDDGFADLLDVVGTNYRDAELLAAHTAKPSRKIIGTENAKDLKAWAFVRDNAAYSGHFVWAGADYLGESRHWPELYRPTGLLDITDEPRPVAYETQSWWTTQPMVYIARDGGTEPTGNGPGEPQTRPVQYRDWTPANSKPHDETILVYSNCQSVELFLNEKSLGSQARLADESPRKWTIPFSRGIVHAIARNDGKTVAEDELQTATSPAKIVLTTDEPKLDANWDSVAFVRATIVDSHGTRFPYATDAIAFTVTAPGYIAATESANRSDHDSFQSSTRNACAGECVAIIKTHSPGKIVITATAPKLSSADITLNP
jgi:beta-galactosidase